MPAFSRLEALSHLAQSTDATSKASRKTPYGLVVEVGTAQGPVSVRLSPSADHMHEGSDSGGKPDAPGYRYYVEPDYQTTCLWYAPEWPGNPRDESAVAEEDLRGRYPESWCEAYRAWVDKYTHAFEANECHLGSGGEPFPDAADRRVWELEGLLLAAWLALQPGVDRVELQNYARTKDYVLEKDGASETVSKFLDDLEGE